MIHKYRYIGRLCLDIGIVPNEFGHLPEYRGLPEPSRGAYGPEWALVGEERSQPRRGHAPKPNLNWVRSPAPSPCPIWTRGEGHAAQPLPPLLFSTKSHVGQLSPWGGLVTSRYSGKMPISPGTLPMSKHRLPIYQYLCLDNFETPRHVRDHIRDSELPSVHQNI